MNKLDSVKSYCCEDISNIENYEDAKKDNFEGWVCHHRLELAKTGGVIDVKRQDLIDWGIYYNRPADELIFLTRFEHQILHTKGAKFSKERRAKMSKAFKGRITSSEQRLNISRTLKGKKLSEERKRKISEALKAYWTSRRANCAESS